MLGLGIGKCVDEGLVRGGERIWWLVRWLLGL